MRAYCLKCKTERDIVERELITMKNGRASHEGHLQGVREVRLSDWERLASARFDSINVRDVSTLNGFQTGSGKQTRLAKYFRDEMLLPVGHDVDS